MWNWDWLQIISCVATVLGAGIAYLAYKNAKEVNEKIDNKYFNIKGNENVTQSHEGTGDNVGKNKHG